MVDENLDVWLIEVNSSPAMDYSTDITERLVTRVLPDCVKVLADYEYSGKKKKPKNIDQVFKISEWTKKILMSLRV